MEDADEDVRDWATFGLGVLGDQDSQTIRDAIYRRLSDTNEEVREEAMVGLGKRMDGRVLPLLLAALKGPTIKFRVAEAASLMLGMQSDRDDWGVGEYCAAQEARFPKSK